MGVSVTFTRGPESAGMMGGRGTVELGMEIESGLGEEGDGFALEELAIILSFCRRFD